MDRDTAVDKGFHFVRLTPVSGIANVSSAFSEQWAKTLHKPKEPVVSRAARPPFIQQTDLSDLMLMLDMMLGGGVMEAVNEGQKFLQAAVVTPSGDITQLTQNAGFIRTDASSPAKGAND